jgi:uncharacterized membrane protein
MAGKSTRFAFVDFVRGAAVVPMVINHTGHSWLAPGLASGSDFLSYVTVTLAAPVFLFVSGFSYALAGVSSRERVMKSIRRDLLLIVLGYVLNQILYPGYWSLALGPLQTIGLTGLVLLPLLPYLSKRGCAWALAAVSVASYIVFVCKVDALGQFVTTHPHLFFSMPIWPWTSLIFLGAALGSRWRAAGEKGENVLRTGGLAGVVLMLVGLVGYAVLGWPDFEFRCSNFSTWLPGVGTALWVTGLTPVLLYLTFLFEKRFSLSRPILVFGKHALFIYLVHRIFIITVMAGWAHFSVSTWSGFALASAALLIGLYYLSELKSRIGFAR